MAEPTQQFSCQCHGKFQVAPAGALPRDLGESYNESGCLLEKGHCALPQPEEKELCTNL